MDWGLILTIIFGVASLFGLFLGWKALFRPKIQLISEDVTVIANIGKISSDISITYKNHEVSSNLRLISAYLINVGNVDIDSKEVEKAVTIVLPKDAKWLLFQVERNNHEMLVDGKIANNELIIKTGLWKKSEGFKFDALISIDDENLLKNKNEIFSLIKIKSRIKGLGDISVIKLPEVKNYKNNFYKYYSHFPTLAMCAYIVLGACMYLGLGKEDKFNFLQLDKDNKVVNLEVINNKPHVITKDGAVEKPNKDGFYNLKVRVTKKNTTETEKILGILTIIMGILGILIHNFKNAKNYLLKRKVEKS